MSVIILLILASLTVAVLFLTGFVWAVRNGQYEDTLTPSMRVLAEDNLNKAADRAVPVHTLQPSAERLQSETK